MLPHRKDDSANWLLVLSESDALATVSLHRAATRLCACKCVAILYSNTLATQLTLHAWQSCLPVYVMIWHL